jgi:hypothetical protein
MEDLTLQIAHVHRVRVGQSEDSHAGRGEIKRCRRPETAASDDQDARTKKLFLNRSAEPFQNDLAAVPMNLLFVKAQGFQAS